MDFTGKAMRGWFFISPEGIDKIKELEYRISSALDFNQKSKFQKRKNRTNKKPEPLNRTQYISFCF
jgi:hypothetical protein